MAYTGAHTHRFTHWHFVQMRAHSQHISHTGIVWGQDLQRKRSRERGGEGVVAPVGGVFSVLFGGNNSLCPRSSTILIRVTERRRRSRRREVATQAEGVSP